jgi:hypothetical protein
MSVSLAGGGRRPAGRPAATGNPADSAGSHGGRGSVRASSFCASSCSGGGGGRDGGDNFRGNGWMVLVHVKSWNGGMLFCTLCLAVLLARTRVVLLQHISPLSDWDRSDDLRAIQSCLLALQSRRAEPRRCPSVCPFHRGIQCVISCRRQALERRSGFATADGCC